MAVYPITEPPGRLGVITAYLMIYVVWGSTYYFIGTALQGFPPFLLGGMRFCTAGLLLLLAGRARGEDIFRGPLVRKSAVSGIILLFVDMAVVMLAQQYLSSSLVAIIASSTAIWIIALDVPMWRRNFRSISVLAGIAAGSWEWAFCSRSSLDGRKGAAGQRTVSCCWFSAAFPGLWGRCTPSTVPARRRRSTMWAGRRGRCSRRG